MLEFNDRTFKLSQIDANDVAGDLAALLVEGEQVLMAFRGARDYVAFTSRRIIAVDVQGMGGRKKDFTTLPYAKVQAYSVETAGSFDRDSEMELWYSGIGRIKFEFKGRTDMAYLSKLVAAYVL